MPPSSSDPALRRIWKEWWGALEMAAQPFRAPPRDSDDQECDRLVAYEIDHDLPGLGNRGVCEDPRHAREVGERREEVQRPALRHVGLVRSRLGEALHDGRVD